MKKKTLSLCLSEAGEILSMNVEFNEDARWTSLLYKFVQFLKGNGYHIDIDKQVFVRLGSNENALVDLWEHCHEDMGDNP